MYYCCSGFVSSAIHLPTGKTVAIKKVHGLFDDLFDTKRILREIRILRQLKHENIIKIVDILLPDDLATYGELYIVFEFMDSDLDKVGSISILISQ